MKKIFFLFFVAISINVFGQESRISKKDAIKMEAQIKTTVEKLRKSLSLEDNVYQSDQEVEFVVDTFTVELRQKLRIELDESTFGMITSTYQANQEYDKLLKKYYLKLIQKLDTKDSEVLKQAQENWIKFRDADQKLNQLLMNDKYSGGGSIQRIFAVSRSCELTKNRVMELFDYLNRITQ